MIKLTKLNGEAFVLNSSLIKYVESRPDTFITLTTEDRVIVRESMEDVIEKSLHYSRMMRQLPGLARCS